MLLAVSAMGCGDHTFYPFQGRLVDRDGQPITGLKGCSVMFESMEEKLSAEGTIDEQGRFFMRTRTANDGARLGKHRVLITRPYRGADKPLPRVIDEKYEHFDSSGLEAVVEPKNNEIRWTLERAPSSGQ
jgi:hypothetical protein